MPWIIEIAEGAARQLGRLDRTNQQRIRAFLAERLREDPRRTGKALQGRHAGLWRYRIGDYRLICRIEDGRCLVLVLTVGHRREVYNTD